MSRNKLLLGIVAVLIVVLGIWAYKRSRPDNGKHLPIVTITQIATHPALDEVRAGLIEGLKKRGYEDGKTITIVFKNANGDPSLTLPIAQEFVRMNPAVIIPISTPSTLSVAKATNALPIVFSGVTDPIGVGLVKDLQRPGGNITGVSGRTLRDTEEHKKIGVFVKRFASLLGKVRASRSRVKRVLLPLS